MGWGSVDFDDQDWEQVHPAEQDAAAASTVWKVAAGVAIGIVIGAAAMYAADRHIEASAWSETVQAFERALPGAGPASAPAQPTRQAAAPRAARPVPEPAPAPPVTPTTEAPPAALPASAMAAETGGRQAGTAPGTPLSDLERKQRAWARYYKKPPYCENNPTSDTLIDCANHYIRARRQFEEAYAAGRL
jgi:hypothetical protein